MTNVETTDKQREQAKQSQILIIEIKEIMNKIGKKWKYKAVDNRNNEFIMQTTIEPRELPITFKVGKKYILPIVMNKSGKVGSLDGQYMELMEDYEEGIVSTIPPEEQGGTEEQIAKITKNDKAILDNEIRQVFLGDKGVEDSAIKKLADFYENPKSLRENHIEELRVKGIPKPAANDKPRKDEMLATGSNPAVSGSQLVVTDVIKSELNIENIIKYLCPKANEQQAFMFLQMCAAQELNPFVGDAYLVAYKNKDGDYDTSMIVAKDAFLKRAEKLVDYEGFEAGIIVLTPEGVTDRREGSFKLGEEILLGGWARVYRKGLKPYLAEVARLDYDTGKNLWVRKASTMIRKVALVQAMREAFPTAFQGMYDRAEIETE